MKKNRQLMWVIISLLLVVNVLTFHDLVESHTLRDWLTLAASVLLIVEFLKERNK